MKNGKVFLIMIIILLLVISTVLGLLYYNEAKTHNEDISKWAKIVWEKNAEIGELEEKLSTPIIKEILFVFQKDAGLKQMHSFELGNVYTFGGNVEIITKENKYSFEDALKNEIINYEDITIKIQSDVDKGICEKIYNADGFEDGTIAYQYLDYVILNLYNEDNNIYDGYVFSPKDNISEVYNELY